MSMLMYSEDPNLIEKDKSILLQLKKNMWISSFQDLSTPNSNEIDEKIKQYSKKIDLLDKNLFLLNLDIITYNEEIESVVHKIIFEQGHLEYEEIKSIKQYVDQKYRNLIVPSIPDELIFLDNKGFLKYVSIIGNYNSLDSFSIIRYAYLLLDFNAEQMKGFFMNDITQAELFYNE